MSLCSFNAVLVVMPLVDVVEKLKYGRLFKMFYIRENFSSVKIHAI